MRQTSANVDDYGQIDVKFHIAALSTVRKDALTTESVIEEGEQSVSKGRGAPSF